MVGAMHRVWVAQRGTGWGHQLEELALVLTGENEGIWAGLLLDSYLATSQTNNALRKCHLSPGVEPQHSHPL